MLFDNSHSFIHQAVRKLNSLPSLPPLWHYDPPPSSPHPQDLPPPPPPAPHTPMTFHPAPPPISPHPHDPPPPHKLWPAPVTLCSTGLISTSSSIVCKLPLLTVWLKTVLFLHYTYICTVLFYLTGLHSICHVPYATLSISFLFILFFYNVLICISV